MSRLRQAAATAASCIARKPPMFARPSLDRKSTRLNSSHLVISYAVFCLKKKKKAHLLYSQYLFFSDNNLIGHVFYHTTLLSYYHSHVLRLSQILRASLAYLLCHVALSEH